jgi:hypothetical protein
MTLPLQELVFCQVSRDGIDEICVSDNVWLGQGIDHEFAVVAGQDAGCFIDVLVRRSSSHAGGRPRRGSKAGRGTVVPSG